jgi:hypothetical protein
MKIETLYDDHFYTLVAEEYHYTESYPDTWDDPGHPSYVEIQDGYVEESEDEGLFWEIVDSDTLAVHEKLKTLVEAQFDEWKWEI